MTTAYDLEVKRDNLAQKEEQYLRANGWEYTSQTPTFIWMWVTEYRGVRIMVSKHDALSFQAAWEAHGK